MFNFIETPRNYFTRELLHDNLSSDVAVAVASSYLCSSQQQTENVSQHVNQFSI